MHAFGRSLAALALVVGMVSYGASPAALAAAPADMGVPNSMTVVTSLHHYHVPPLSLVNQYGHRVRLDKALGGNEPVLVQFFFTTCTTICGVRNAQLIAMAPMLAKMGIHVGFYTISLDPNHDTPRRLLAYSRHFGSAPPPNWHLLTGTEAQIKLAEAAFNASDPSADKMMHKPLTFIRGGKGQPWERINGLTTTRQLVSLIQTAVADAH